MLRWLVAFGLVAVGAAISWALQVSGESLNPARSPGPDIAVGKFPFWWICIVGPVVGAGLWTYVLVKGGQGRRGGRSPCRQQRAHRF